MAEHINSLIIVNYTTMKKYRVLFACTGNTCRSVMAEFIARRKFGELIEACSAGFHPQSAHDAENAIYILKLRGIDASSHRPRDIHDLDIDSFDLVVVVDNCIARQFHKAFPSYPREQVVKWKISDPWGDNLAEYERCAKAISAQLRTLLPQN